MVSRPLTLPSSIGRRRILLAVPPALASLLLLGAAPARADVTAPAEVRGLLASRVGSDVDLSWTAVTLDVTGQPETISSYRIYRGLAPGFVPDKTGGSNLIGTPATTSFADPGAAATASSFYYLVSAVDGSGNESATKSSTVTAPPALSSSWTETTIELQWTQAQPAPQVTAYRVYYGRAPQQYEFVKDVGLALSTSLNGLQTSVAWYCSVRAVDVNGNESAFSNEVVEAVAGRARVRAHDDDYICWGASKCPPKPGEVQRQDGWELNVPVNFPPGNWTKVTVTYTIDSRLCTPPANGTTDKCGGTNPGGYNPCGDPWDRIANLWLVLDDCITSGGSCHTSQNLTLMRAITPFGTDAPPPDGSGTVPPRVLALDVTPFQPLLAGRRYVGAEIGHFVQAGWHVTVDFDFSKRPEEASSKRPADGIAQLIFDDGGAILTPRTVTIPADAQQVFSRFFVTGHGGNTACDGGSNNGGACSTSSQCPGGTCQNCDEFCHREQRVKVDGQIAWDVTPWRDDCSPGSITACTAWNACGWPSCTFSRAGWCPGYIACHKTPPCDQDVDLTTKLTPGATHNVTWEIPVINGSWAKSMAVYWYRQSVPICGNNIKEGTETCDGTDLGGQTCQTQGFDAGTLACNSTCTGFNTSSCRFFGCGNNFCEIVVGEDCLSCPQDCNGVQSGNPSSRYCCGDGAGQNPIPCSDPRCTAGGKGCE